MPRQPNYYRILDVALQADQAQVQHAYRTLAKRYHPDRVPRERREWARAQMARINAAYEVLGNPTRRTLYDRQQGYIGSGKASATNPQSIAPRGRKPRTSGTSRARAAHDDATHGRAAQSAPLWRHERRRREWMSRQRMVVLSSLVALGALLLGALYWWRVLSPTLPQHRWTWAIFLSVGLGLVLIILGRTAR